MVPLSELSSTNVAVLELTGWTRLARVPESLIAGFIKAGALSEQAPPTVTEPPTLSSTSHTTNGAIDCGTSNVATSVRTAPSMLSV